MAEAKNTYKALDGILALTAPSSMTVSTRSASIAACVMLAVSTVVTGQAPASLAIVDVLDRAAAYIAKYEEQFSAVVSEEHYTQSATRVGLTRRRDLKSDVLVINAGVGGWMGFRDVYEVDGRPIRDRADRIAKLFLTPSASAQRQVDDITAESARYNIGSINRNVNLPTLALSALDPENRAWFDLTGARRKDGWEIDFKEQRSGTLIRTSGNQSMPSHGKFTVDQAGRVLASELVAESETLHAQIDVTYAVDSVVGILVPREMREKYTTSGGQQVEGRATYAKFRRYTVTVDEKVKK